MSEHFLPFWPVWNLCMSDFVFYTSADLFKSDWKWMQKYECAQTQPRGEINISNPRETKIYSILTSCGCLNRKTVVKNPSLLSRRWPNTRFQTGSWHPHMIQINKSHNCIDRPAAVSVKLASRRLIRRTLPPPLAKWTSVWAQKCVWFCDRAACSGSFYVTEWKDVALSALDLGLIFQFIDSSGLLKIAGTIWSRRTQEESFAFSFCCCCCCCCAC